MKKSATTFLAAALFATTAATVPVSANESTLYGTTSEEISSNGTISLDPENRSDDVIISDVMTFDEIVKEMSEDMNISISEASSIVKNSNGMNSLSDAQLAAATYRTFSKYLDVSPVYQPQIKFYCETTEGGGSFRGIVQIVNYQMDRRDGNVTKQFSGTLFAHLEHANKIHWIVNGDFYHNGNTNISGGGSIGLKGMGEITFSISGDANHFTYFYDDGDFLY
ncbi:hypothetical protein ACE3NQ_12435 [Paenibacillus terreus]|uniref:Uncharacterized protein n=1 Tax=Paenibacillus terreus TaxID=1387834 RepID=A0ABV5B7Q1_9BACL